MENHQEEQPEQAPKVAEKRSLQHVRINLGPLGSIEGEIPAVLLLAIGFIGAFLSFYFVLIPKRVPILVPPLVEAVLTSQPTPTPVGHLVVMNERGDAVKTQRGPSYELQPHETVLLRYQPTASRVEYKLISAGNDSGELSNVRGADASYTAPSQPGSEDFLSVCVIDDNWGRCDDTTQRLITLTTVTAK